MWWSEKGESIFSYLEIENTAFYSRRKNLHDRKLFFIWKCWSCSERMKKKIWRKKSSSKENINYNYKFPNQRLAEYWRISEWNHSIIAPSMDCQTMMGEWKMSHFWWFRGWYFFEKVLWYDEARFKKTGSVNNTTFLSRPWKWASYF